MHSVIAVLSATAAMWMPTTAPQRVDWLSHFTPAAIQYWGAGHLPSCGQPTYAWGDTPPDSGAMANPDTCVVTFNSQSWPTFSRNPGALCAAVVHELGHLYGHDHSEGGIMAPVNSIYLEWQRWAPCRQSISVRQRCRHGECYEVMRPVGSRARR